jgi:hypothetical protein
MNGYFYSPADTMNQLNVNFSNATFAPGVKDKLKFACETGQLREVRNTLSLNPKLLNEVPHPVII